MPKDIQLARWGNPYSTTFAGGDLIKGVGEAGRAWRAQGMARDIEGYSEETMYMADQHRREANEGDLTTDPQGRLHQSVRGRAGEMYEGGESGLVEAEKDVGERAFRNFKRYKDAVDQGAGNPAAARISIEKEMRDMIRANPGFADVISNAAQQSMTSSEFQLLTRDPDAVNQVNQELTPFQKAQKDLASQAEYMAMAFGWDQETKDGWYNDEVMKYVKAEALGRSLSAADSSEKLSDKQVDQYAQGYMLSLSKSIEDLIFSSGILEGEFIPQEGMKALKNDFALERKQVKEDFLARVGGKGASSEAIEAGLKRIDEQFNFVDQLLDDNSAHELLKTYAETAKAGNYMAMTEFMPIYTMFSDVFGGDNAAFMVSAIFNPNSPESQYAYANSPILKELRDKARDRGLTKAQEMEYIAEGITNSSRRYLTRQVISDFDEKDRQAAEAVLKIGKDLKGDNKVEFEEKSNLANLAKIGDPLFAEYLVGSTELTKESENIVRDVYKPSIDRVMDYAHDMSRSFEEEGNEAYTLASMDDNGVVSLNVIKRSSSGELYVYPVVDDNSSLSSSGLAMNSLSVFDTESDGKQSLLSGTTRELMIGKDTTPRSWLNGQLLYVNNNSPTPKWINESKDPKVNSLFRNARRLQEVYSGL